MGLPFSHNAYKSDPRVHKDVTCIFFRFFFSFLSEKKNMSTSQKLVQFGKQHIARGIGRSTELVIERGQGSYIYTVEGKKYLDLTTGKS